MNTYKLEIDGIDGEYAATLKHEGEIVSTASGFRNPKSAQRWSRSVAQTHKDENRPARVETYAETFHL